MQAALVLKRAGVVEQGRPQVEHHVLVVVRHEDIIAVEWPVRLQIGLADAKGRVESQVLKKRGARTGLFQADGGIAGAFRCATIRHHYFR